MMNLEWMFAAFVLHLMTCFQKREELLVDHFLELLNTLVLEHKVCLKKFLLIALLYQTDSCSFLKKKLS